MEVFDKDKIYKFDTFIRRIEHEHTLINNRLSGFLTAQGFLFAAFVLGHDKIVWFTHYIIPALGLVLSVLIILSIISAKNAMGFWRGKISAFFEANAEFQEHFDVTDHKTIYRFGMTFQYWAPTILLLVWLAILCRMINVALCNIT